MSFAEDSNTQLCVTWCDPCIAPLTCIVSICLSFDGTCHTPGTNPQPRTSDPCVHDVSFRGPSIDATSAFMEGGHFNPAVSLAVFLSGGGLRRQQLEINTGSVLMKK